MPKSGSKKDNSDKVFTVCKFPTCQQNFLTPEILKNHVEVTHFPKEFNVKKGFKCFCGTRLEKSTTKELQKSVRSHILDQHAPWTIKCEECSKPYASISKKQRHMIREHPKETWLYFCGVPNCKNNPDSKNFDHKIRITVRDGLTRHIRELHSQLQEAHAGGFKTKDPYHKNNPRVAVIHKPIKNRPSSHDQYPDSSSGSESEPEHNKSNKSDGKRVRKDKVRAEGSSSKSGAQQSASAVSDISNGKAKQPKLPKWQLSWDDPKWRRDNPELWKEVQSLYPSTS